MGQSFHSVKKQEYERGYNEGYENGFFNGFSNVGQMNIVIGFDKWQFELVWNNAYPGTKSQITRAMRDYNSKVASVTRQYQMNVRNNSAHQKNK